MVAGGSFIGLEVSASLRARGIAVDVVATGGIPLERVMGREVGRFIQALHEAQGVVFHLGQTVTRIDGRSVTLSGGSDARQRLRRHGCGCPAGNFSWPKGRPDVGSWNRGERIPRNQPSRIYAAGRRRALARLADPATGSASSTGWWPSVKARSAARNMLGHRERFDAVPFFWSQHYDITINYVGHAEKWDTVRYRRRTRVARLFGHLRAWRSNSGCRDHLTRSRESRAEVAMEHETAPARR